MANAACESLDRMKEESKKATLKLVDMECSYLTVDFFRKLPQDVEKGGNPSHSIFDRYNDSYLRRIGKSFKLKICLNIKAELMLIVTLFKQEQLFCLMSIWSVQVSETPFPSPSSIVKSERRNGAYLTISSLTWVKWR